MSGHFSLSKTNDNKVIFNIDGIFIVCDDEVKLNFNSHVANICKNAAIFLHFIDRNQLINTLLSSSKKVITFSKDLSDFDMVLSSV
jgi:hypothetical protein